MNEEEITRGIDISETGTPVEISLFEPAQRSGYIPREGFYPDAEVQLSAGPKPDLPLPELSPLPLDSAPEELENLWKGVHDYRVDHARLERRQAGASFLYNRDSLPYSAFAPDSEVLFERAVLPIVEAHCAQQEASTVLVDDVGYPLPFWFKDQLQPLEILEGKKIEPSEMGEYKTQLQKCIVEGALLPKDVGVVYLDFPSTVDTVAPLHGLIRFIHNNPNVLFVIDQANLYFSGEADNLLYDLTQIIPEGSSDNEPRLTKTDNVLILNTSTKSGGTSGCAALQGTEAALKLASNILGSTHPEALGFTEKSFLHARQALVNESGAHGPENVAAHYRDEINKNTRTLTGSLIDAFGEEIIPIELRVIGPHIFVDATQMGFKNAQELCDYLYEEHSIATKPASVYTNTDKHPEFLNYTYISIPTNENDLQRLLQAFSDRKNILEKTT